MELKESFIAINKERRVCLFVFRLLLPLQRSIFILLLLGPQCMLTGQNILDHTWNILHITLYLPFFQK